METIALVTFDGDVVQITKALKNQVTKYIEQGFHYFMAQPGAKGDKILDNEQRKVLVGLYLAGLSPCEQRDAMDKWLDSEEVASHFINGCTVNREPSILFHELYLITYKETESILDEIYSMLFSMWEEERRQDRFDSDYCMKKVLSGMGLVA